jgi:hypothetical protein
MSNELVSKRFSSFKIKEGDNFNHRNTLSISRIKIEPDAEIGRNGTF